MHLLFDTSEEATKYFQANGYIETGATEWTNSVHTLRIDLDARPLRATEIPTSDFARGAYFLAHPRQTERKLGDVFIAQHKDRRWLGD